MAVPSVHPGCGFVGAPVVAGKDVPFTDCIERMLFAEALETQKCIDEGVLTSDADANIGSIFGIGFPAWTGGVVQYVKGYEGGVAGFVARAWSEIGDFATSPAETMFTSASIGRSTPARAAAVIGRRFRAATSPT